MTIIPIPELRTGKALFDATRPFAVESTPRSWWHVGITAVLLAGAIAVAVLTTPWWPLRLAVSAVIGLLLVRAFILYHDYMHGNILASSRIAKMLFYTFGTVTLTPPVSWRSSHNFHHGHVGKIEGSHIGSFPLMTTEMWANASFMKRLAYRFVRSPITILCGYLTIFFFTICLLPLLRKPLRHWDSALSIIAHFTVLGLVWWFAGFAVLFFALLAPLTIGACLGGYLFYAQHNAEGLHNLDTNDWTYYRAAVESSSYLKLGRLMRWFTANIGYHHVHHLNPHVPFYRLPEATKAIPELQNPIVTTLRIRDIINCFRLNLWDPVTNQLISYRQARRLAAAAM